VLVAARGARGSRRAGWAGASVDEPRGIRVNHRTSLRPGDVAAAQAATTSTPCQNATWSAISAASAEGVG
jgi:hypothetical protein